MAPPRARPDQRDRHGAGQGLRSVPGGVARPDRPRRRPDHDPPVPDPRPRPRLVVGAPARPRPGARIARARPLSDGGLPAAPDPDDHDGDRHAVVRHPGERGGQPGRRLVAGGRGGLPDRVGVGRPARPDLDPRTLAGIQAVAAGHHGRQRADDDGARDRWPRSSCARVDPAYDAVLAGTPAALPLDDVVRRCAHRERRRHPGPPDPGRRVDEAGAREPDARGRRPVRAEGERPGDDVPGRRLASTASRGSARAGPSSSPRSSRSPRRPPGPRSGRRSISCGPRDARPGAARGCGGHARGDRRRVAPRPLRRDARRAAGRRGRRWVRPRARRRGDLRRRSRSSPSSSSTPNADRARPRSCGRSACRAGRSAC